MSTTATLSPATWKLDPSHTLVEFSAKHMMFTTVKGRFTDVQGTVTFDPANPSASSVEVTIGAASIDTRDAQRDGHLRSPDFLDAERFPTLTFRSRVVAPRGSDRFTVTGALTIHGVTREVTLDTTLNGVGRNPYGLEVAGFTGETRINRRDFGLEWNVPLDQGGVLVSEEIKILLEVQAARQQPEG